MKKILSIILSTIMIVITLASCADIHTTNTTDTSSTTLASTIATTEVTKKTDATTATTATETPVIKREYTALVYDFTDGGTGVEKEIDLKRGYKVKENTSAFPLIINQNVYDVNNNVYIGRYEKSWVSKFADFDRDEYNFKTKDFTISYAVNAETNKVESYSIAYNSNNSSRYEGRKIYSQEECLEIAMEYMEQYVPNIARYTLVGNSAQSGFKAYDTLYRFKFREYIDDLPICNDTFVNVNMYGEIMMFDYHTGIEDVEAFKESKFLESLDWDAIDEAIGEKACQAYESVDGFEEYFSSTRYFNQGEYTTTKTLVKMADGRYALQCQAYVFLTTKEDQNIGKIDSVLLLVYLE